MLLGGGNMHNGVRRQEGTSMVEFVLMLPLLLLILAGVGDLGRVFRDYIIITNVAREGARYASLHADPNDGPSFTSIKNAAIAEAQSSGIALSTSNVALSFSPSNFTSGSIATATITVTYGFSLIIGRIWGGSVITMQSKMQMKAIGR